MEYAVNERIAQLRKQLKLSQNEFARKLEMTAPAISRIENKEVSPQQKTISAIARVFNVSLEWLNDGTGEMLFPSENFHYSGKTENWKDEAYQLQNKYISQLESQVEFLKGIVQKVVGTSPNFHDGIVSALGIFPGNTVSAA